MPDKILSIKNHLESNDIKIIDIHIGKTICVIVKHVKIDVLTNLLDSFSNINVVNIIPTVAGLYHYIFITE